MRRAARERPERLALVAGVTRLTWHGFDASVTSAALALLAAGPAPGDRVMLQLGTGADFAVLYLGALRAGLVAVPVNPSYTPAEVEHIRTDSGAVLHLDATSARGLLAGAPSGPDPRNDRAPEDVAALMYTSGTSGRAKGAMLSARALGANLDQIAAVEPALLTGDDVLLVPLPLSHIFGLNAGLGMALRTGATAVLVDRFEPGATLETMAAEGVTALLGVPGQYGAWLAHPAMARGFASVRFAMSGSATLGKGIVDGFAAAGVTVHDGYGLTEAAPVVTINALGPGREHPTIGHVGLPLPGIEVELRDPEGEVVDEDGDPGRIWIRGDNLFSGYWPDGADGPDADGWFGTGDIAIADGLGQLRLVGRTSDLVIVYGFNVYPAEVESALADADGVAEVAVVGVADARTGEAVRAYVVPALGVTLRPEELLAVASRSLARFKLPSAIEIVTSLPRTVTGKIMKWQLDRGEDVDGPA
ncbi:MAG TPA: AMP-binding protein [Jatrophihabitans sp.]|uniref:AMP-binding protein n=1 Tax=Jatrophihabitans sp. TaxID=1932789 RepID=UPI002E058DE9|nr:AMP-binding protein [Jatrophihabitans sp.]